MRLAPQPGASLASKLPKPTPWPTSVRLGSEADKPRGHAAGRSAPLSDCRLVKKSPPGSSWNSAAGKGSFRPFGTVWNPFRFFLNVQDRREEIHWIYDGVFKADCHRCPSDRGAAKITATAVDGRASGPLIYPLESGLVVQSTSGAAPCSGRFHGSSGQLTRSDHC